MIEICNYLDPYLIMLFHITGYSFVDFLIGNFILAFVAVVVGEFTISLVFLINRRHIEKQTGEIVKYQNLSIDALAVGDKEAYQAANKMANDAFGKSFFSQIAMSAAFVWPIFFVMTWLQYRFAEVDFSILFTDYTVGCFAVFVPLYAAAYLIFKRIKPMIPYFRRIKAILDSYGLRTRKMKTLADLAPQNSKSN
jgi:hypothetical protein